MGNGMERHLSLNNKAKDAMKRLDALEAQADDSQKTISQLAMAIQQAMNQTNQDLGTTKETLDAVIGLMGVDSVQKALVDARLARMQAAADANKATIAKGLEAGDLVKAEKVSDKSLIVGREIKADGAEIPPGYAALRFNQVKDDYKAKLLGQGAGFTLDTEAGGKFEVMEVYDLVEKPAPVAAPVAAIEAAIEAAPAPEAPASVPAIEVPPEVKPAEAQ